MIFYHYLRPYFYANGRAELSSFGGICLRFEAIQEADGILWFFSFARCHPKDRFNKATARAIADTRAEHFRSDRRLVSHCTIMADRKLMVERVIHVCRNMDLSKESQPVQRYLQLELMGLADDLELLRANNIQAAAINNCTERVVICSM